jgi:hypothetical protein
MLLTPCLYPSGPNLTTYPPAWTDNCSEQPNPPEKDADRKTGGPRYVLIGKYAPRQISWRKQTTDLRGRDDGYEKNADRKTGGPRYVLSLGRSPRSKDPLQAAFAWRCSAAY